MTLEEIDNKAKDLLNELVTFDEEQKLLIIMDLVKHAIPEVYTGAEPLHREIKGLYLLEQEEKACKNPQTTD